MKQKLLMIAELIPYPSDSGGKLRTVNMMKQLARSYDIDYVCYAQEPATAEQLAFMQQYCRSVYVFPGGKPGLRKHLWFFVTGRSGIACAIYARDMQTQIDALCASNRYAWVWVERLYSMPYLQTRHHHGEQNVILNTHDVDHEMIQVYRRTATNWIRWVYFLFEYRRVLRLEARSFIQAKRLIACSEQDREKYIARFPLSGGKWLVANNGIDLPTIGNASVSQRDAATVLFVVSLDYFCNWQGIIWFLQEIWGKVLALRPDATCLIAGSGDVPHSLAQAVARSEHVTLLGYVDDVYALYRQATCLAVPLQSGSGTRLKILEALALGLPVISTSIGAEGLLVNSGEDIIIVDEPGPFANGVARLLGDETLRAQLSERGARLVKEHYTWDSIMNTLLADMAKGTVDGVQ